MELVFVRVSEQTAIISLYNITWLVFIKETECVYCAVRTGYLNTRLVDFSSLWSRNNSALNIPPERRFERSRLLTKQYNCYESFAESRWDKIWQNGCCIKKHGRKPADEFYETDDKALCISETDCYGRKIFYCWLKGELFDTRCNRRPWDIKWETIYIIPKHNRKSKQEKINTEGPETKNPFCNNCHCTSATTKHVSDCSTSCKCPEPHVLHILHKYDRRVKVVISRLHQY
jgi:hypothetical protein